MTELSETTGAKLVSYIRKASKNAGHHDYLAGQADGAGNRALAKTYTKKAERRRAGIDRASGRLVREAKKFDRIEPTFGPNPNRPKPAPGSSVHNRAEPTMTGKPHPTFKISRGDKGRYKSEPIGPAPAVRSPHEDSGDRHTITINRDHSVDYHSPSGEKHKLYSSMKNKSSVHGAVLDAVKFIKHQSPSDKVHVQDHAGGYKEYHDKTKKSSAVFDRVRQAHSSTITMTKKEKEKHEAAKSAQAYPHRFGSFPNHTISEETDWDPATRTNREVEKYHIVRSKGRSEEGRVMGVAKTKKGARKSLDKHDNDYGGYAHSIKPIFKESTEMVAEGKYTPKKLKDIVSKPTKKWNEYKGNTKDEQDIVQHIEDETLKHPDRNGNGDDVFNASGIKRVEKPVQPGQDEKGYDSWQKDVANVSESEAPTMLLPSQFLDEAARPLTGRWGSEKITARHLDYHWATKTVAPRGASISTHGDDAVIHHGNGDGTHSTHRIENGAKHISEMPKGTYDSKPEGRSDAHAGKYNVVRTVHAYGKDKKVDFVGDRKKSGLAGGHVHTADESGAKEFKSSEHAQNHANMMNHHHEVFGDSGHPTHWSVHEKRDSNQIKSSKKAYADAAKVHSDTLRKHGGNIFHPDVEKSYSNMESKRHPAFRGAK